MGQKHHKSKSSLGRIWHFIWEDDSPLSWIVNIILAFVLIKFVVYPGLGWILGTSHPVVAVVSGSMEHRITYETHLNNPSNSCSGLKKGDLNICGIVFEEKRSMDLDQYWETCGSWYLTANVTKSEFASFPLKNGFNRGDIIVLRNKKPEDIKTGDVIIFQTSVIADPIIHRVVKIKDKNSERVFQTKGDHNAGSGGIDMDIKQDDIIGVAWVRIPYLGYIKIWATEALNSIKCLLRGG
ncbi:signal peptidase I [Candidatus Woesearchaeota archaeon CG_4_10_14_0_8_um_filter_47_5]|nr:MAG: signal peptidase I [Candidatus Woesearchaeota archaeon CG_4_10_14_0_8_um_filter_47_5]